MAASDSLTLLLQQMSSDLYDHKIHIKNFFAIIGAWYALRFTVKLLYRVLKLTKNNIKLLCRTRNFVKDYGAWAVVTGPTSGIGRAFVHKFAKKGLNIVLISRNGEALDKEASFIEDVYGVHTAVIVCDFNNLTDALTLKINTILNELDIGILVNNVGIHYEYPMEFHMVDEDRVRSLVQINIAAAVMLTRTVLPGMVSRNRGLIVNMSSAAGFLPYPLISLYSASKSFLDHFSQSLYAEMSQYNVHVQSLTPFYISTRMIEFSQSLSKKSIFIPTPETYVNSAIKTLGFYKSHTGYFPHTLQYWMVMFSPRFLAIKIGYWLNMRLHHEGLLRSKNL